MKKWQAKGIKVIKLKKIVCWQMWCKQYAILQWTAHSTYDRRSL